MILHHKDMFLYGGCFLQDKDKTVDRVLYNRGDKRTVFHLIKQYRFPKGIDEIHQPYMLSSIDQARRNILSFCLIALISLFI